MAKKSRMFIINPLFNERLIKYNKNDNVNENTMSIYYLLKINKYNNCAKFYKEMGKKTSIIIDSNVDEFNKTHQI